jgi:hypothetical protein
MTPTGRNPTLEYRRVHIDVDAGMAVIRLRFRVALDRADDPALVLDRESFDVGLCEIVGHRHCHVFTTPPPTVHLWSGADPCQLGDVGCRGRSQPHSRALQRRYQLPMSLPSGALISEDHDA